MRRQLPSLHTGLLLSGCLLLNACASTPVDSSPPVAETPYDGQWEIISQPVSAVGADEARCSALYGNIRVLGGRVMGDISKSGESSRLDLNAQLDPEGSFEKGLAFGGKGFASFNGKFDSNYARGMWRDERNCQGVWAAIKNPKPAK